MDVIWSVLPFLALLACPVLMAFCMFGMNKFGRGTAQPDASYKSGVNLAERVLVLRQQLEAIQDELAVLQPSGASTRQDEATDTGGRFVALVPGVSDETRRPA
jgi:hypothetical protein